MSQKHNFVFIHIYKNAGTSFTSALLPFAANLWHRNVDSFFRKLGIPHFGSQPFPPHITASELIDEIGKDVFDSFFSFAIVRNPWDWQVSLYAYMLKTTSHAQHELVKNFGNFDTYIRWRCREEIRFQKDMIYSKDDELLVKFVGKHETLDADFKTICSRIGISASLPRLNISNTKPYQQYYNESTRELVRQSFETDISLFGYDF